MRQCKAESALSADSFLDGVRWGQACSRSNLLSSYLQVTHFAFSSFNVMMTSRQTATPTLTDESEAEQNGKWIEADLKLLMMVALLFSPGRQHLSMSAGTMSIFKRQEWVDGAELYESALLLWVHYRNGQKEKEDMDERSTLWAALSASTLSSIYLSSGTEGQTVCSSSDSDVNEKITERRARQFDKHTKWDCDSWVNKGGGRWPQARRGQFLLCVLTFARKGPGKWERVLFFHFSKRPVIIGCLCLPNSGNAASSCQVCVSPGEVTDWAVSRACHRDLL